MGVHAVGYGLKSTQSRRVHSNNNSEGTDPDEARFDEPYVPGIYGLTDQEPKVSDVNRSLPVLNQSYRPNLTCSLARLLEDNGVKNLLWGDMLHYIHGGEPSLPHVWIPSYNSDPVKSLI